MTVSWPSARCGLTAWAPLSRVAWTSTRPPRQLPPHFALVLLAATPLGSFVRVINVHLRNPLDQLPHFGFSSHRILNNLFELLSPLSKCDRFSQHVLGFVTSRFRAHAFYSKSQDQWFCFQQVVFTKQLTNVNWFVILQELYPPYPRLFTLPRSGAAVHLISVHLTDD